MKQSLVAYLQPSYLLSLPERLVRATAAMAGGMLYEFTQLALPGWVRQTRLYQTLVYRFLRLTVELVGEVEQIFPPDNMEASELAVRKAIGNVVEFAGILTVGLSPLWVLAAISDLTGGTRAYLRAFIAELKKDGLLTVDTDIETVDDLLSALENSTSVMADMIDVPPLRAQDLRISWEALKRDSANLPGPSRLAGLYQLMQQTAMREERSIGMLSSLVAAGAVRAGYSLGSVHIFDYYHKALGAISTEGWAAYIRRSARPYSLVARSHFNPKRFTYSEKALKRFIH